jgi:glycosyltransferase involved in cell wall biosynthesis
LEPYHWGDKGVLQRTKKALYWRFMGYPAFRWASVVHAITPLEQRNLAVLFPTQRIALIPNAVDLRVVDDGLRRGPAYGSPHGPVVGFVGRFHPKKGAHLLIEAFAMADLPSEWQLVLAGPPGHPRYMAHLARLGGKSKVKDRIKFIGPLTNGAKWNFYRSASVVAVPSLSEVVSLVNLEAAACGTPTITTRETGLDEWEDSGGILIEPNIHSLANALTRICSLSIRDYEARSVTSRRFVEEHHSWERVKQQWRALYQSVI